MAATYRASFAGGDTVSTTDRFVTVATPAVGDLWVVFCVVSANTNASPTMSDDNGGTYTRIATALKAASADIMSCFVRNQMLANTTSTVVTAATGSNTSGELVVIAVSGMVKAGATGAVRQSSTQANQASGTPAPVFGSAVLTANMTIGAVGSATNGASVLEPASWTERQDTGQNTPTVGLEVITRDSGFTGTTLTWGGAAASAFCAIIVELDGDTLQAQAWC